MKRITIGRSKDCDIVINDERDNVSRKHAVISFSLWGRMTLSDTSSNGTFINDRRMLKGASLPVTRDDKIRLGDSWVLDWSRVADPYRLWRRVLLVAAVLLVVGGIVAAVLLSGSGNDPEQQPLVPLEAERADTVWNSDSTGRWAPTETHIDVEGTTPAAKQTATPKAKNQAQPKRTNNRQQVNRAAQRRYESIDLGDSVYVDDEDDYYEPQQPKKMRTVRSKNAL